MNADKFKGWNRQKLIERIDNLEKTAMYPKSNKENVDMKSKNQKLQQTIMQLEKENLGLKSDKTGLQTKFKELFDEYESYKEIMRVKELEQQQLLETKILEIQNLKLDAKTTDKGVENIVDNLQCQLNAANVQLEAQKSDLAILQTNYKQEVEAIEQLLTESKSDNNELIAQIKELQTFNVADLDDSLEMLEIPKNGTETTTLYSELEDQRLELSHKYNKLLRQYRYLRSQQSLYSLKSHQEVYQLEHKVLDLTTQLNELSLVKINEILAFKDEKLPNGTTNYLSSGYGYKHEVTNRMLHKQVQDLNASNKYLRTRLVSAVKELKKSSEQLSEKESNMTPSKRQRLELEQETECKTQ